MIMLYIKLQHPAFAAPAGIPQRRFPVENTAGKEWLASLELPAQGHDCLQQGKDAPKPVKHRSTPEQKLCCSPLLR